MSVINQVLSDLEKRGATALPGDTAIRAVPMQHKRRALWLVIAASILGLAAGVLWWNKEKMASAPLPALPAPIQTISTQANLAPPELIVQKIISTETAASASADLAVPAMQLSFELSSIPLPSNLRAQSQPAKNNLKKTKKNAPKPVQTTRENPPAKKKSQSTALANSDEQIKQFSSQQLLDNEVRRATALVQQGRSNEAYSVYEAVLKRDAGYDAARQAMVAILLDSKRNADAEHLLLEGLQHNAKNGGFAMLLARLQVERGALSQAVETLHKTLPYAERQADYQAFIAALLQRQNNHQQAIEHYQIAVQLVPNSGVWLMGLGISLHAVKRNDEARDVFQRAIATGSLNTELQAFVEQRLKELK